MSIFYYDKRQLYFLTIANVFLLVTVVLLSNVITNSLWWCSIVSVICLLSVSASAFVTLLPQKLASISEIGIRIDHNELLKWEDIKTAEKIKPSRFSKRMIIVFKLKENVTYPLSFMQKLCTNSPYGAFSIPLYAMTKEDKERIEQEIEKYVKIS